VIRWIILPGISLILLATPTLGLSQTDDVQVSIGKSMTVSFFVGVGTQALGDVNDNIEAVETQLKQQGFQTEFEKFSSVVFDLGGEFDYRLTETVSVGGTVNAQWNGAGSTATSATERETSESDLLYLDLTVAASYWFPSVPGLCAGVNAGYGRTYLDQALSFRDSAAPANDFDAKGEWDGSGFVFGAFAGYERYLKEYLTVYGKAGYQRRDMGTLAGGWTSSQLGDNSNPPTDVNGNPLEFDLSGFYFRVGVGFAFGTPE